jgi:hypothetical protein
MAGASWAAILVANTLLAHAAWADPILDVSPGQIDFPTVTLGDTTTSSFSIKNAGDATLTVTTVDLPPGAGLTGRLPFDVPPGDVARMGVDYAPIDTTRDLTFTIHSNDPRTPAFTLPGTADVRALAFTATAFTPGGSYPIGEAMVVQASPFPGVRLEKATLYFRSGGFSLFQPIDMFPNGSTFVALIPGASVQEGGVEFYVRAENDTFSVMDPASGPARPARVVVESPHDFKLEPVTRGFGFPAGQNIDFMLTLTRGTVFETGTLHYRACGDKAYHDTEILEISFTGVSASIPGPFVGPRGVEYWAEITTLTRTLTLPLDPSIPKQLAIGVENLKEPRAHAGAHYRMVSVPLELPSGTGLATILSDEGPFGSYDPVRWRAFRYLPGTRTNLEWSAAMADSFVLKPGRAFWLVSRDPHQVDTAPAGGASVPGGEERAIVLEPGWNQWGNPFAFPVAWSRVRHSAAVGEPVAYDSDHDDYSNDPVTDLAPFTGYFIENTSASSETLFVPPVAVDSAQTVFPEPELPASVRIEARSARGADLTTRVGLATAAREERDALDRAKPPAAPGAAVRLALANHGWSAAPGAYRRDVRPLGTDGNTWELELTTAAAADPVTLTLSREGTWPAGTSMRLVDREVGTAVELDPHATVWRHEVLASGARPYRLGLIAGTADYVRSAGDPSRPARVTLDPVAPNPSRGAQRVRFGLPRAAAARLEVFDASGRRIATLVDAVLPAGYHTALWRPERAGSSGAASGIYFHRLTVDGETRTVRSVLVR